MAGLFETADTKRQERLRDLQNRRQFGQTKSTTLGGAVGGAAGRFALGKFQEMGEEQAAEAKAANKAELVGDLDLTTADGQDAMGNRLIKAGQEEAGFKFKDRAATTRANAASASGTGSKAKVTVNDGDRQLTHNALVGFADAEGEPTELSETFLAMSQSDDMVLKAKSGIMRDGVATAVNTLRRDLDEEGVDSVYDQAQLTQIYLQQLDKAGILKDKAWYIGTEPVFDRKGMDDKIKQVGTALRDRFIKAAKTSSAKRVETVAGTKSTTSDSPILNDTGEVIRARDRANQPKPKESKSKLRTANVKADIAAAKQIKDKLKVLSADMRKGMDKETLVAANKEKDSLKKALKAVNAQMKSRQRIINGSGRLIKCF